MSLLAQLESRGVLAALDRHFALALARLGPEDDPDVLLAAALASRAVQRGHVCADLARLQEVPLLDGEDRPVADLVLPELGGWLASLAASPLVRQPDADGEASARPLVVEAAGRIYLARYWWYQRRLADAVARRAAVLEEVDAAALQASLDRLFPPTEGLDLQRVAAAVTAQRRLSVISGGPGTGKTSTVARVLALLQEQARARGREPWRVLLMAPTGKAAQRLGAAIESSLPRLRCDEDVRAAIPTTASTIHRALGAVPRRPTRFRHDAEHPLPADIVVVDEASMVDLALMAKLTDAVSEEARLVLLGDRHQLASVEAGAILGDICGDTGRDGDRGHAGYSEEFARASEALLGEELPRDATRPEPGLHDCVVQLTRSYRYDEGSGIAALAHAVNAGDAASAAEVLSRGAGGVRLVALQPGADWTAALGLAIEEGFGPLGSGEPAARLGQLDRFRILCAHRRGPAGVEQINALVEAHLRAAGLLTDEGEWYEGRPILVRRNDYQLELFNGDVGVIARADAGSPRAAWFPAPGGGLRSFVPSRLPPHETVFATTVHKSQGSEFDDIAVLMPEEASPILTRELVYTAITRARRQVVLYGAQDVLRTAIARRIDRASGLADALWRPR